MTGNDRFWDFKPHKEFQDLPKKRLDMALSEEHHNLNIKVS